MVFFSFLFFALLCFRFLFFFFVLFLVLRPVQQEEVEKQTNKRLQCSSIFFFKILKRHLVFRIYLLFFFFVINPL